MFSKYNVLFLQLWNDPSILADNAANLLVLKVLTSLSTAISIVVRTDSSGTSEIFSDALDAMSPAGYAITQTGLVANSDGSFHDQVTPSGGSQSPFWCGPLTDELQYITVTGCNPAAASKLLTFRMVDASYTSKNVTFNCDSSARTVRSAILSATLLDVHVKVTTLSVRLNSNTTQIEIGYGGLKQQRKNWYNPILLSAPSGVAVTVKAKQEGGYLNTVTTCTAKPTTAQTMSIWILVGSNVQFSLAWTSLDGQLALVFKYSSSSSFFLSSLFSFLSSFFISRLFCSLLLLTTCILEQLFFHYFSMIFVHTCVITNLLLH